MTTLVPGFDPQRAPRTLIRIVLVWALIVVVGCSRNEGNIRTAIAAQRLNFDNEADPRDLDPHTETGALERRIIATLFEGLLTRDAKDARLIPAIAERWDVSEDGKILTFHLRDARWSDGQPVTTDDFVATFHRLFTPALGSEQRVRYYAIEGARDFAEGRLTDFARVGLEAIDARTLRFTLHEPCSYLLDVLAEPDAVPLPISQVAKFGGLERRGTAWTRPGNIIGNGAFRLKEWSPQQRIVVEKSPTYWDAAAVRLKEVVFHPTETVDVVERMFRTGALQIGRTPPAKIDAYRRNQPEMLWESVQPRTSYVVPNVKRAPFGDARVRRALALAIDRARLVTVLRNGSIPAFGLPAPNLDGYPAVNSFSDDVALARQLLAEAGFPGGKGLAPLQLLFSDRHNVGGVLEALQEMWRTNLGLEVRLSREEWKVYLDSEKNGHYDLAADGWGAYYPCAYYELLTTTGSELSWYFWRNPEYDQLFANAARAIDRTKRHEAYRQMDRVLAAEMPVIPLYHWGVVMLVHPSVRGYERNPLHEHPFKAISLEAGR
jgi:oligopeptide transport system substrate-binding protein